MAASIRVGGWRVGAAVLGQHRTGIFRPTARLILWARGVGSWVITEWRFRGGGQNPAVQLPPEGDERREAYGSDRDLLLGCRARERGAWRRLLGKYERLVYSIPLRYGLSREDAADVAQVAFTALIQNIDDLPEDSRLGGWLSTVAKRHTWKLLGRARRERANEHLEGAELAENALMLGKTAAESIEHWELTEWVEGGLAKLGDPCRELLLALYFSPESPSYAEVAASLGMPVGSIGPTRARCLKRLQQALGAGDEGKPR